MNKKEIIRKLIDRTQFDFSSYFLGTQEAEKAKLILQLALDGNEDLSSLRIELESMIPDTNEDGSWEASYALNSGVMIINLIDYMETQDDEHYREAVTMFFDTVDFKVQQQLEAEGIQCPTEEQIENHHLFLQEKDWFRHVESCA